MPRWLGHILTPLGDQEASSGPRLLLPPSHFLAAFAAALRGKRQQAALCRGLATEGLRLADGLSVLRVGSQLPAVP